MKLKLSMFAAGALTLLALSALFIAAPAAAQTTPTATPEAPDVSGAETIGLTVTGVITNATAGAASPAGGLEVRVHTFDPEGQMDNVTTLTTTLSADGKFIFENVASQAGWQIAASTEYQGVLYASSLATISAEQSTADLSMTVYETTPDTAAVSVEQMHLFFDFGADTITVMELFIVSNSGDRTVVNPKGAIEFVLPEGATGLVVEGEVEGVDYIRTAQGFAETRPIVPGSGMAQILASFSLPYPGELSFEQQMLYPVTAAGVMVPENGVTLTSSGLQDEGLRNMGEAAYRIHGITDMKAGETLSFQLSGMPANSAVNSANTADTTAPASAAAQAGPDPRAIGIGLGVLGVVVVGVGLWFYRRQSGAARAPEPDQSQDELIQAIADLDDEFEAGDIEEAAYQRRRAGLKAQLTAMMESEQ